MKTKNISSLSKSRLKTLFGFSPGILAEILILVLPVLEEARTRRLTQRPDRKRPPRTHEGAPRQVTPRDQVLMTLLYLRHNVTHEIVGDLFGFSADSSEDAFHDVVPILRDLFPKEKWNAEKRFRKGLPPWTPDQIDRVIIDSFETPIPRPSGKTLQKRMYSGKKKRHTLKSQVVTDQKGEILDIEAGRPGPMADIEFYRKHPMPEPIADKPRLGDKAYVGTPGVETPMKKPKGRELTEEEKEKNREISGRRVYVEHGIRRLKGFKILRGDYRHALGLFPMVASAVVGLIHFSRILA